MSDQFVNGVEKSETLLNSIQARSELDFIKTEIKDDSQTLQDLIETTDAQQTSITELNAKIDSLNLEQVRSMIKELMVTIENQSVQVRDMLDAASITVSHATELLEASKQLSTENFATVEGSRILMDGMKTEVHSLTQSMHERAEASMEALLLRRDQILEEISLHLEQKKEQASRAIEGEVAVVLDQVLGSVTDVNDDLSKKIHDETVRAEEEIQHLSSTGVQQLIEAKESGLKESEEAIAALASSERLAILHEGEAMQQSITSSGEHVIAKVEEIETMSLQEISKASTQASADIEKAITELASEEVRATAHIREEEQAQLHALENSAAAEREKQESMLHDATARIESLSAHANELLKTRGTELEKLVHESEEEFIKRSQEYKQQQIAAEESLRVTTAASEAELKAKEDAALLALTSASAHMTAVAASTQHQVEDLEAKVLTVLEHAAETTQEEIEKAKSELKAIEEAALTTVKHNEDELQAVSEQLAGQIKTQADRLENRLADQEVITEKLQTMQTQAVEKVNALVTDAQSTLQGIAETIGEEVAEVQSDLAEVRSAEKKEIKEIERLEDRIGLIGDTITIEETETVEASARASVNRIEPTQEEDTIQTEEEAANIRILAETLAAEKVLTKQHKEEALLEFNAARATESAAQASFGEISELELELRKVQMEGLKTQQNLHFYEKELSKRPDDPVTAERVDEFNAKVLDLASQYREMKSRLETAKFQYENKVSALQHSAHVTKENSERIIAEEKIATQHEVAFQQKQNELAKKLAEKRLSGLNGPQLIASRKKV